MVEDSTNEAQHHYTTADTKHGGISWFIWTIFLLPVLYFLSVGPVARCYPINPPVLTFYRPLISLASDYRPFGLLFSWYVDELWLGHTAPRPPARVPASAPPPSSGTSTN